MTDTPRDASEIADYRLAVERHLADLPTPIREDLLNDLEAHLTEIAAELEPGVDLADRLGTPEAYARELRETAEIEKESVGKRFRHSVTEPLRHRARQAADRFTTSAGVGEAAEFGKALKPGWWVLRGLIAASLLAYFMPLRELEFFGLAFFVALVALVVWLSLRLGARSREWGRRRKRIVAVGGVGLFGVGLLGFIAVGDAFLFGNQGPSVDLLETNGDPYGYPTEVIEGVTDVYPYTEDGEPLDGVYLFDQDGNPLRLGDPGSCPEAPVDPFEERTPGPFDETVTERPEGMTSEQFEEEGDPDLFGYGTRYPLCGVAGEQSEGSASDQPSSEPTTEEPTAEPTTESPSPSEAPTG